MPILYVYASKKDNVPFMMFSGCPWRWDSEKGELYIWDTPEGVYTFPIKEMNNTVNDMVFYAYGEVD